MSYSREILERSSIFESEKFKEYVIEFFQKFNKTKEEIIQDALIVYLDNLPTSEDFKKCVLASKQRIDPFTEEYFLYYDDVQLLSMIMRFHPHYEIEVSYSEAILKKIEELKNWKP